MYARWKQGSWLLYDLKNDPYEMKNLVDDPKHSPAIGIYIPQSSKINARPIVGINIKTGKQVYAEDRRTSWLMSVGQHAPKDARKQMYFVDHVPIENHFTVLRPGLRYTGLLAPSQGLPGVEERIRCEEFLLMGTPDQIRAAIDKIRARFAGAPRAGSKSKAE